MKTKMKKIIFAAIALCLALAFSTLAFADSAARARACPKCGGTMNETFRPHYTYTYWSPHDGHMDWLYYDVDLLEATCSKCGHRIEEVKTIYRLIQTVCPGMRRSATGSIPAIK